MKVIESIPPVCPADVFVCLDVENYYEKGMKAHRPQGTFACLSVTWDGENVYQFYDSGEVKQALRNIKNGVWVFHNALYDLTQLRRYADIEPTFIWDTMLVDQSMTGGLYSHYNLAALSRRWLGEIMEKDTRDHFLGSSKMTAAMKKYAAKDVVKTLRIAELQKKKYENEFAFRAYTEIDEPAIFPVLDMGGIPVDAPGWRDMTKEFSELAKQAELDAGVNVYSSAQVKVKAKQFGYVLQSTGKDILKGLDHPFFRAVEKARMYRKAVSTYGETWLENVEADGKVYSSYRITGALTGRMSCVSGKTILSTSRGDFTIQEYLPEDGDLILTHTGQWKPIKRKIYKGIEDMYQVECYNMSVVQCTLNHQLLTPTGWKKVGELHKEEEVLSDVNFEPIRKQQAEYRKCPASVFGGFPQVWLPTNSRRAWNFLSQCRLYYKNLRRWGAQVFRAHHTNVQGENGRKESHERYDWNGTSKIQGFNLRWSWIFSEKSKWKVHTRASSSYGGSSWIGRITSLLGRSSHQRRQDGQLLGQSSLSNQEGSRSASQEVTKIREIAFMGKMGVWDIEVSDDHSYIAGGLIHHNSSEPNMQNIPARTLPVFRTKFIPSSSKNVIMVSDVSQQEPRILAYESQDEVLISAIINKEDLHLTVAKSIFGDFGKDDKDYDHKRSVGKTINLGTAYGLSEFGLADKLGIPVEKASEFLRQYFTRFRGVFAWISKKRSEARQNGYVTTAVGRRIYINPYNGQHADNNAINSPIQGGAADFTKMWLRKIWELCRKKKIKFPVVAIVHDEIVCDIPKAIRKKFEEEVLMKAFHDTAKTLYRGIPFEAETVSGYSWGVKQNKNEVYEDEE
jgi:DNA polymerase I-like protein with 3'-5' exonuclease and polymerase domains